MSQLITNTLMKELSLVSKNPQKYGKYADNYVVKDPQLLAKIMRVDKVEDWIFSATYNELKIDEKALKKEEAKKEEVKKEEVKQEEVKEVKEEVQNQPAPEENEPEIPKEEPATEQKDSEQAARDAIVEKLTDKINEGWGFLAEDINDILVSRPMRSFMLQRLHNGLFEPMMETVEKISKEFANTQVSVDETMKKMAAAVFAEAYKLYKSYGSYRNKSVPEYAAAQKVANIVMSENSLITMFATF